MTVSYSSIRESPRTHRKEHAQQRHDLHEYPKYRVFYFRLFCNGPFADGRSGKALRAALNSRHTRVTSSRASYSRKQPHGFRNLSAASTFPFAYFQASVAPPLRCFLRSRILGYLTYVTFIRYAVPRTACRFMHASATCFLPSQNFRRTERPLILQCAKFHFQFEHFKTATFTIDNSGKAFLQIEAAIVFRFSLALQSRNTTRYIIRKLYKIHGETPL